MGVVICYIIIHFDDPLYSILFNDVISRFDTSCRIASLIMEKRKCLFDGEKFIRRVSYDFVKDAPQE